MFFILFCGLKKGLYKKKNGELTRPNSYSNVPIELDYSQVSIQKCVCMFPCTNFKEHFVLYFIFVKKWIKQNIIIEKCVINIKKEMGGTRSKSPERRERVERKNKKVKEAKI